MTFDVHSSGRFKPTLHMQVYDACPNCKENTKADRGVCLHCGTKLSLREVQNVDAQMFGFNWKLANIFLATGRFLARLERRLNGE